VIKRAKVNDRQSLKKFAAVSYAELFTQSLRN